MTDVCTWDQSLFLLINTAWQHPILDFLMPLVTNKWNFVFPMILLAVYFLARGGRQARLTVANVVLMLLLADTSATVLRSLVHRVRPCQVLAGVHLLVGCTESFSFPSNHATNVFALAAFFACYSRRLVFPLLLAAGLVGYSRVYVGVHYPLDVLGGAALGSALGWSTGRLTRALARNRAG